MSNLKTISGHANPDFQQFYQHNATGLITKNFHAFTPVNGDVAFTSLIGRTGVGIATANVATAYNTSGTYYKNVLYTGTFAGFNLSTGEVLCYLGEQ